MAEAHRLRHLQVGEAGHDRLGVLRRRARPARAAAAPSSARDRVDLVAQPQAHVGRDLVVARAAGVQALAGVADELRQARLDVQVHVLEVELPLELAGFDLLGDLRQAALDRGEVVGRDDALRGEHLGVRQAAVDVGAPQALVEADARGVALDQLAHRLGEQRRPGLGFLLELIRGHVVSWERCACAALQRAHRTDRVARGSDRCAAAGRVGDNPPMHVPARILSAGRR